MIDVVIKYVGLVVYFVEIIVSEEFSLRKNIIPIVNIFYGVYILNKCNVRGEASKGTGKHCHWNLEPPKLCG